MIYIPNHNNRNCVIVNANGTIRVYDTQPTQYNTNYYYTDYYANHHYMYTKGYTYFNQYSSFPTCLSNSEITTNYLYRYDFADICIIFLTLSIFVYYIPFKLFKRLFRRFN